MPVIIYVTHHSCIVNLINRNTDYDRFCHTRYGEPFYHVSTTLRRSFGQLHIAPIIIGLYYRYRVVMVSIHLALNPLVVVAKVIDSPCLETVVHWALLHHVVYIRVSIAFICIRYRHLYIVVKSHIRSTFVSLS